MEITISQKLDGTYPKVTDINNVVYNTKKEIFNQLVQGESYEVVINTRSVISPKTNKPFTARDIIKVIGMSGQKPIGSSEQSVASPVISVPNMDREKAIKENMAIKDLAIREVAAMNNASQMVDAVARCWAATDMIKQVSLEYIVSQLKSIYQLENESNRTKLKLVKEVDF